jgi:hypothetical protein
MNRFRLTICSLLCFFGLLAHAETPAAQSPVPLQFAWGANIDGAVELSGHNMSTFGLNGEFGLQYRWIRFLGASAEADITIGNSSRLYPFSVVFRTDFCNTRQLMFLDVRGGVALLYHEDDSRENSAYASAGVGVTLAHSKTYSSHLILGYTYVSQDQCSFGDRLRICPGISYISMRFGITF